MVRSVFAAGLVMVAGSAWAQVEEETVTRDDLTKYVYQAIVAQHPHQSIDEINEVIIDGEVTGYKVKYSGGSEVEFTSDGHVVGRNPDLEQSYNKAS
jgi:hypothetical protein